MQYISTTECKSMNWQKKKKKGELAPKRRRLGFFYLTYYWGQKFAGNVRAVISGSQFAEPLLGFKFAI